MAENEKTRVKLGVTDFDIRSIGVVTAECDLNPRLCPCRKSINCFAHLEPDKFSVEGGCFRDHLVVVEGNVNRPGTQLISLFGSSGPEQVTVEGDKATLTRKFARRSGRNPICMPEYRKFSK